jgi:hypothetical protein
MKSKTAITALLLVLLSKTCVLAQTNAAPLGLACTWAHNLESTADSNKVACPELNDGDADSVVWLSRGEQGQGIDDIINAWQAAGVMWESAQEIREVVYINGPYDGTVYANGAFSQEGSFRLQISRDGTTWEDSEIISDPEYMYFMWDDPGYGALVTDQPFSFRGEIGAVKGVRVTGVVHNWEAGSWNATCRQVLATLKDTGMQGGSASAPARFALYPNYPNPFNSGTVIRYDLAESAYVQLRVVNVLGERIKTLVDGMQSAGVYTAGWPGLDDRGAEAPSGVYLCFLEVTAPGRAFSKMSKMSVMR